MTLSGSGYIRLLKIEPAIPDPKKTIVILTLPKEYSRLDIKIMTKNRLATR